MYLPSWDKRGCTTFQRAAVVSREEQRVFSRSTPLPPFCSAGDTHTQASVTSAPAIDSFRCNAVSAARPSCLDRVLKIVNSVIKHLLTVLWL